MQDDLDWPRGGKTGVEHNRRRQMQLSRICRGTNQQKAKKISIDPPGVEKLSRRQELSRSIHQVSRSCRDCDKKKLKKLDKQQGIEEVSRRCWASLYKNSFSRCEKHRHECNPTCNSTNDPINILSSQKHLSINRDLLACIIFHMFCIFLIIFVSIASSFSFSCRSMVPCSPCSLYVSFLFVSVMSFGFLCHLTIVSKGGEIWELNVIP